MIRKLLYILAIALLSAGCASEMADSPKEVGYLVVSIDWDSHDMTKAAEVDMSEFDIIISGQEEISCKCAELPEILELSPGAYSISVSSPGQEPAAFDQPMYGGHTTFDIKNGQTSSVKLICSMLNMKVTVNPSTAFTSQVKTYEVTVDNGYGKLIWTKADVDDGKAGYFTVAPLSVSLTGVSLGDAALSYYGLISDVEASDHHIISFDTF